MTEIVKHIVYSTDGEMFNFDSVGEVIDAIESDLDDDESVVGYEYFAAIATRVTPDELYSYDELCDDITNRMWDLIGEAAEPLYFDGGRDAFNSFFESWVKTYSNATKFYTVRDVETKKITQEDYDANQ